MQIEKLNLSALACFCCKIKTVRHKCQIRISDDTFVTVRLCNDCIKLDETELRMKFTGYNLTVKQAAKFLQVNEARVRQFIYAGRLFAHKVGRDLLIKTNDLEAFAAIQRKTGRPTISR